MSAALQRTAKSRFRVRRAVAATGLAVLLSSCQMIDTSTTSDLKPSPNPVTVDTDCRNDNFAEIARQQNPRILAT